MRRDASQEYPYNHPMRPSTPSLQHVGISSALAHVPGVAYAIVFGSSARGTRHARSDLDVALGFGQCGSPSARELGAAVARLEEATCQTVDVVLLDSAPAGLAYRVFRDGVTVLVHDRDALVERKVRAIIEYLDYQPIEQALSKAVLTHRAR